MKKCPFCAEEIQDEAVKCRHCGSDLSVKVTAHIPADASVVTEQYLHESWWNNPFIRFLSWSMLFIIYLSTLGFHPYLAAFILLLPIWIISFGKKEKLYERLRGWREHRFRIGLTVAAFLLSIFVQVYINYSIKERQIIAAYPVPTITILSETGIQGTSSEYELSIQTTDTISVIVNDTTFSPDENGYVYTTIPLSTPSTNIAISALNKYKSADSDLVIERDSTEEERVAEQLRIQQEIDEGRKNASDLLSEILDGFSEDIYSLSSAREEIRQMRTWSIRIDSFASLAETDEQVKVTLNSSKNALITLQKKRFPIYRKNFSDEASDILWEHDVDVRISGTSNGILTLTSYYFASKGNIKDIELTIVDTLKELRFDQVRYEWYEGSEYTYYDLETPNDGDPI